MKNVIQKLFLVVAIIGQVACIPPNNCEEPRMTGKHNPSDISIVADFNSDADYYNQNLCTIYIRKFLLTTPSGKVYQSEDYTAKLSATDSLEVKMLIDSFSVVEAEKPIISARVDEMKYYISSDPVPSEAELYLDLTDKSADNPDEVLASIKISLN